MQRVLELSHYPTFAGDPGGRKIYYRVKQHFYWTALAAECYATVLSSAKRPRNRLKLRKNVGALKLFPATAPLKSVCIDILGELVGRALELRYLLVIKDRFTKLVRTVLLRGVTTAKIAKQFVNKWAFSYGPPIKLIAENGHQFKSRFFKDVCKIVNVHNSFKTTYNLQTNDKVEIFNSKIRSALRAYVSDHRRDWDLYTSTFMYAYN